MYICVCMLVLIWYTYIPPHNITIVATRSRNTEFSKREIVVKKKQYIHYWATIDFFPSIHYDLSLFPFRFFVRFPLSFFLSFFFPLPPFCDDFGPSLSMRITNVRCLPINKITDTDTRVTCVVPHGVLLQYVIM